VQVLHSVPVNSRFHTHLYCYGDGQDVFWPTSC